MINLVVGLPMRRCQSQFMNVTMWEHPTFDSKIFGCSKVDYSDSIIITLLLLLLLLLLFTLQMGFLPSSSGTTIRHNTQITHIIKITHHIQTETHTQNYTNNEGHTIHNEYNANTITTTTNTISTTIK
jgi:hypothetical protein